MSKPAWSPTGESVVWLFRRVSLHLCWVTLSNAVCTAPGLFWNVSNEQIYQTDTPGLIFLLCYEILLYVFKMCAFTNNCGLTLKHGEYLIFFRCRTRFRNICQYVRLGWNCQVSEKSPTFCFLCPPQNLRESFPFQLSEFPPQYSCNNLAYLADKSLWSSHQFVWFHPELNKYQEMQNAKMCISVCSLRRNLQIATK